MRRFYLKLTVYFSYCVYSVCCYVKLLLVIQMNLLLYIVNWYPNKKLNCFHNNCNIAHCNPTFDGLYITYIMVTLSICYLKMACYLYSTMKTRVFNMV